MTGGSGSSRHRLGVGCECTLSHAGDESKLMSEERRARQATVASVTREGGWEEGSEARRGEALLGRDLWTKDRNSNLS
jgi:hypothetical protein